MAQQFDEQQLEQSIISLLGEQGYPHVSGPSLSRSPEQVLILDDLRQYLAVRYEAEGITEAEIESVVRQIESLPASDLYDSNKTFCAWLAGGFTLKREDAAMKDFWVELLDTRDIGDDSLADINIYKMVNQLEIEGREYTRIPDGILYINGLPLVVFEFKSAIREERATLAQAWDQVCKRYRRDIPQLFVTNALCVISDGANSKMGSLFAPYEFFYAWRKITGDESVERDGIDSLLTMIGGLFDRSRLRQVMRDFIFFPDKSTSEEKIVCRYPQFYAVNKLYDNILRHKKPEGDGKGGTYFGATGCGKSYTMQFLARRLMKSLALKSPTLVLITDRTDLDGQLSKQFTNASDYIGDKVVQSVDSRDKLRELLAGRSSGGVFLTTIHKFTEDTALLTERANVICISDEAHRSQTNLDMKVSVGEDGVHKSYGFAHYLHQALPNATFVGFSGTPIDATFDVFGPAVDSYTMSESVRDEITVRIVYEGRAAKVLLDNRKLDEIESYYDDCVAEGASEYHVEASKKASAGMNTILGDPDRLKALAQDFEKHYTDRVKEGSTVMGKAMFVSSSREVAWAFYQELKGLKAEWFEPMLLEGSDQLSEHEQQKLTPIERVKMVMTRGKDDDKELFELLGNKEHRKALDGHFKNPLSNFKIAIVVDMWLTGFDVPELDTIYIDKPIQAHNLIQTISRVNRKFADKNKGLVVDYIGIKSQMNQALAQFSRADESNFEDIALSVTAVKDQLDLLKQAFHRFDASGYFSDEPVARLHCLKAASEFVQQTEKQKKRFVQMVKRLKAAYDICCGSEELTEHERDQVHFYLAVRSIVMKMTTGNAPDTAKMNAKVRAMIAEAIKSDGVEEIFALGDDGATAIDIFDPDYLARLDKLKLPNTKIQLLQKLLKNALAEFSKTNKAKAFDFTDKFQALVNKYNERREEDAFTADVHNEAIDGLFELIEALKNEKDSFVDLGISLEQKAFYDILKMVAEKYQFPFEDERLLALALEVKMVVDDQAKFPDWSQREDIKAALRVNLIMLLAKNGYPPVGREDVYKAVFEQAENYKTHA